jgi:RNA polymerase sigma-70 factor, ECF subfamily
MNVPHQPRLRQRFRPNPLHCREVVAGVGILETLGRRLPRAYDPSYDSLIAWSMTANKSPLQPTRQHDDNSADRYLMSRIAAGDKEAFEKFYYSFSARLGRFLKSVLNRRDLADEALNDTLLAVWQMADRYDPDAGSLISWLYGIAHNKARKVYARASRHTSRSTSDTALDAEDGLTPVAAIDHADPETKVEGWQLGQNLSAALDTLSADHRTVLELAFVENLSYAEIAAIMDCPINTVKTRVLHARKHLGQVLAERGLARTAT